MSRAFEKISISAVGIALSVTLIAGPAVAQNASETQPQSRWMRLLDTDKDGKVTNAEIAAEQKRLMTAADVDGDGTLSVEEFRRRGRWFQSLHVTTLFDLMDANGDKTLSADEISAPSQRWLSRYDANNDGAISDDELAAWRGRKGRAWRRGGGGPGGRN